MEENMKGSLAASLTEEGMPTKIRGQRITTVYSSFYRFSVKTERNRGVSIHQVIDPDRSSSFLTLSGESHLKDRFLVSSCQFLPHPAYC